ncbi:ribonuclease [Xaviernesmea oryzae]|uniref:Ribonuclease E n=1 Tax=Xaviernesmea oryzae TaxID=464029 RepID=A0A1Q9AST2_9HYPH|nr:ribonuclease E/G [Xaviernesmea oryzae]OLP58429.1 ribonuclease [Xaviernesmea oryzae]SEM21782.1 ribonuclease E [Xaviernesmea oryzae]
MAEKMLIDASHSEETRVVVVRGNRIEEFDFESEHKKQIRGNIYLAKVTRVEPSLQAAFVDYGGNRHGFLAFAEIHPDYYQIPLADRQALLKAEAEDARRDDHDSAEHETPEEAAIAPAAEPAASPNDIATDETAAVEAVEEKPKKPKRARRSKKAAAAEPAADAEAGETAADGQSVETVPESPEAALEGADTSDAATGDADAGDSGPATAGDAGFGGDQDGTEADSDAGHEDGGQDEGGERGGSIAAMVDVDEVSEARPFDDEDDDDDHRHEEKEVIESVGAEDAMEEVPDRQVRKPRKQYRIQEVIKRRQILLVQVAKEERGNKGAALTTYLSLAGRYSVLMPNTARGGGISRKITNLPDRKRLKDIAKSLDVPQGMGVILRTAGANRTKVEIKRDFEYLMRLWENVRTLTLASTAPCLVYEEGSLIKRSIRDLYNKDISEIVVAGEEGYREAKAFMKMLMPSHAKVVQPYRDVHPIFSRAGIEAQLDRMLQPQVTLKSGGYIIINQTEALVAIDVNSGRSTREHSIEDTALQTNLEAAEEVARQLRLRDLAGLIVVDFIDMEEKRNNRAVEKRLKDCLKNDRARIQVGRISHFGLLEMSRQRIRASVLESTTQVCSHCGGTGHVRSQSSIALHVLRGIEEYLLKNTTHNISVRTTPEIALYLLNHKRGTIIDYEDRFGVAILIQADALVGGQHFAVDRGEPVENPVKIDQLLPWEPEIEEEEDDVVIEEELDEDESTEAQAETPERESARDDEGENGRKRKRRRRRRGRNGTTGEAGSDSQAAGEDDAADDEAGDTDEDAEGDETDGNAPAEATTGDVSDEERQKRKRRRRGKRGGRRSRADELEAGAEGEAGDEADGDDDEAQAAPAADNAPGASADETAIDMAPLEQAVDVSGVAVLGEGDEGASQTGLSAGIEPSSESATPDVPSVPEATAQKVDEPESSDAPAETAPEPEAAEKPARRNRDLDTIATAPVVRSSGAGDKEDEAGKPKKGGWWQRRGFL